MRFDWRKPRPPVGIPGSWFNVDGRLGAVIAGGAGAAYLQAAGYHPQTAVCADTGSASFSNQLRQFKPGDVVARRAVVIFVEVSSEKTAALAKSVRVEETQQERVLHFRLPEGKESLLTCIALEKSPKD